LPHVRLCSLNDLERARDAVDRLHLVDADQRESCDDEVRHDIGRALDLGIRDVSECGDPPRNSLVQFGSILCDDLGDGFLVRDGRTRCIDE
jgi:hypothetical protein